MGRSASDSFLHRQQVAPGHTAAVESQPGSESQTGGFLEGGPSYPSIPKVVGGGSCLVLGSGLVSRPGGPRRSPAGGWSLKEQRGTPEERGQQVGKPGSWEGSR